MPIYEYQCQSCGHEFETLQKISDPLLTDCPKCKAEALKKKVSAAAFRLKGGGWYETDFKTGNKKNVAGDNSGGDKSGGDKSGGDKAAAGDKKSGGDSSTKSDSSKSASKSESTSSSSAKSTGTDK